jgi:acyl-CoA dehydrogenase
MSTTYAHLTDGQRALLLRSEVIALDILAPLARSGEPGRVNRLLIAELSTSGLVPRVLGSGRDLSVLDLCLIREGLARFSTEAEIAFALQGLGSHPILSAGRAEVADVWMPRVIAGEAVAAFALTEPDAGSDAASLSLSAERDGDGFRLSGDKVFISNAPEADIYTVFARTTTGAGARGITAFALPGDSPGLSGTAIPFVADHPIGRLHFDGVAVPASHVLGEVDHGFGVAMRTLDLFRPSVGAAAVGMAQAALDSAVAYAQEREAFGRPLSALQGVSHQLADVATRVQASRLLVHSAAAAHDAGITPITEAAAMAKLFATETAALAVDVAIQVHGARALEHGHLLEHLYREVRGIRIYEGASEVQREIIARQLFRRAGRES